MLAGRRMTTPLITVSIVGLAVGGASTIGGSRTGLCKRYFRRLVHGRLGPWGHCDGPYGGETVSSFADYDGSGNAGALL